MNPPTREVSRKKETFWKARLFRNYFDLPAVCARTIMRLRDNRGASRQSFVGLCKRPVERNQGIEPRHIVLKPFDTHIRNDMARVAPRLKPIVEKR